MLFKTVAEQLRPGYFIDGVEIIMVSIYPTTVQVHLLGVGDIRRRYGRYDLVEYELPKSASWDIC